MKTILSITALAASSNAVSLRASTTRRFPFVWYSPGMFLFYIWEVLRRHCRPSSSSSYVPSSAKTKRPSHGRGRERGVDRTVVVDALIIMIERRKRMRRGERECLKDNEQRIRALAQICLECTPYQGIFRSTHLMDLIQSPRCSPSLVEAVAAACPEWITGWTIQCCFCRQIRIVPWAIQETLIRYFQGNDVSIDADLDEASMRLIVRVASSANPKIKSIRLVGEGITPRLITELGIATTFTRVYLYTSPRKQTQEDKKDALNRAMIHLLRNNQSITSLTLIGAFHSSICSGISADDATLKCLALTGSSDDAKSDDFKEVKCMLERNHGLRSLAMDNVNDDAVISVAAALAVNRGLHKLRIVYATSTKSRRGVNALLETLANHNTTLRDVHGLNDERLQYYCDLNQAGSGAIRNFNLSHGDFLAILHGAIDNVSVLYGLLRDVPYRCSTY